MTNSIMARTTQHVNSRFVPAVSDFEQGKRNYRNGKRISTCTTDAMTQGWLAQEEEYRQQYWTAMGAEEGVAL